MVIPICWMQVRAVAGWIAFTSFHLHDSISKQCDSYVVFADAQVKIIVQLLVSKTRRV